tara:strand:+ start:1813 stop:2520 length:708 start_codon:yes stop_codon:yes gene_type:complete
MSTTDPTPDKSQGGEWCPRQEKLLRRWAEKAAGYRWLHNWSRLHFKRQNDMLSYPSIIIASITGVGGFAVLSPDSDARDEGTKTKIMYVQYFFAFLNVVGGILTSISKFSQASYLAEQHSVTANAYSKFYRNIDMELSIERENRPPMLEYVVKTRKDYDRLLDDAPDIPAVAITAFNERFRNLDADTAKPDVCNGLSKLSDDDRSDNARASWKKVINLFRTQSQSLDNDRPDNNL